MDSLKIGFAREYYTLWTVSEPYKVYFGEYQFEWRVKSTYIQNLSRNKDTAIKKAIKFGVKDFNVDESLKGDCRSFESTISGTKVDQPDYEFPFDIDNRYRCCDIRKLGTSEDLPDYQVEKQIKALWFLYLKKSIYSKFIGTKLNPHWVRPIVYARRRLIELGLLVKFEGEWMPPKAIESIVERRKEVNGHFYNDNERVELEATVTSYMVFDNEWGTSCLIRLLDSQNRVFVYLGSGIFANRAVKGSIVRFKATISHDEYKGVAQTKIKRPKIID